MEDDANLLMPTLWLKNGSPFCSVRNPDVCTSPHESVSKPCCCLYHADLVACTTSHNLDKQKSLSTELLHVRCLYCTAGWTRPTDHSHRQTLRTERKEDLHLQCVPGFPEPELDEVVLFSEGTSTSGKAHPPPT